jgi:NarL family two-component system response regulator LiaR
MIAPTKLHAARTSVYSKTLPCQTTRPGYVQHRKYSAHGHTNPHDLASLNPGRPPRRAQGSPDLSTTPNPDRSITVALVDDLPLIRDALTRTLTSNTVQVIGEAANGQDAIELVLDLRPDVVLIDVRLPASGISGIETITQLGLLAPTSRTLVLARSEHNQVVEAIIAGASGYILKTAPAKAIIAAVTATAAGETVLSPQIAGKLLDRVRELDIPTTTTTSSSTSARAIRAALTERELQIFTLLASGHSNQQIGDQLELSANTIAKHLTSILAKLHLENRIQAAVQAVRSGIS